MEQVEEQYNAVKEGAPKYDSKLGKDSWLGRRVLKTFGDHGDFEGIVFAIDEDAHNPDHRLFCVHYFDDPEDGESMWPDELFQ